MNDEHDVVEALGICLCLTRKARHTILRPFDFNADQSVADHREIDASSTGTNLHLLNQERSRLASYQSRKPSLHERSDGLFCDIVRRVLWRIGLTDSLPSHGSHL